MSAIGVINGSAKLTEAQVLRIRADYEAGWTLAALARRYDIRSDTVSLIVKRKTWTHLPEAGS